MKQCNKCKRMLPYSSFTKESQYRDGYRTRCRACRAAEDRERMARNKPASATFFTPEIRASVLANTMARYQADPEYRSYIKDIEGKVNK